MTRTRTISEIRSGAPSMEGPYPKQHGEARATTPKTTKQGVDGTLRKVKKMMKPKKKESKKISEKKKEVIAEVMIAGRPQQGAPGPVGAPEGDRQRMTTTMTWSRVVTARDLMQMSEGRSWLVRPDVYCTGLYKGKLPTMMVSELMEWDQEEGLVNRTFTTHVKT